MNKIYACILSTLFFNFSSFCYAEFQEDDRRTIKKNTGGLERFLTRVFVSHTSVPLQPEIALHTELDRHTYLTSLRDEKVMKSEMYAFLADKGPSFFHDIYIQSYLDKEMTRPFIRLRMGHATIAEIFEITDGIYVFDPNIGKGLIKIIEPIQ